MLKAGRLPGMLATADKAARELDPTKRLRKICELNVSISRDREKAIEFPKRQVSHSILQWEALGFTAEEYAKLGVQREQVLKLKEAYASGATVEEASKLVSEHMVKTYYAAGRPEEVRDQIIELVAAAGRLGYDHVAFAKLGPNYEEAINLLADQVVPALSTVGSRFLGLLKCQDKTIVLVALLVDVKVAGVLRTAQHVPFFGQFKTCAGDFLNDQRFIDAMQRFHRFVAGAILGRMIYDSVNAATL